MLYSEMKKNKAPLRDLAGDLLLLGALVVTKSCVSRIESRMREKNRDKEKLERSLTMAAVLYQVIGIFYNE